MLLQKASIEFEVMPNLELLPLPKAYEFLCQLGFRQNIEDLTLKS